MINKRCGYILVETLISVVVLSFGLILVLDAFGSQINALRTSRNYTYANILLEEKLCEIEREAPIDVNEWKGKKGNFLSTIDPLKSDPRRNNFDWEVDIGWLKDSEGNLLDIVTLKITVGWNELKIRRELNLTAYIRRKTT